LVEFVLTISNFEKALETNGILMIPGCLYILYEKIKEIELNNIYFKVRNM